MCRWARHSRLLYQCCLRPLRAGMRTCALALAGLSLATNAAAAQPRVVVQTNRLPVAVQQKIRQGTVKATLPSGAVQPVNDTPTAAAVQLPANAVVLARADSVAHPASSPVRKAILDRIRVADLAGLGMSPAPGMGAGVRPDDPPAVDTAGMMVTDVPIEIVTVQGTSGAVRTWRPYVVHAPRLGYDRDRDRFTGQVLVGLRSSGDAGEPLTGPVGISLLTDASVEPDRVTFAAGNVAPARVAVTTTNAGESVALHLQADGLDAGEDVRVSLALPTVLRFENPPPRLQAFGAEPRWVTLGTRGARLSRAVHVRIGGGTARVEPDTATIEPGGAARVKVIAEDPGPFVLSAEGDGVIGTTAPLDAVWPVRFVMATLLGGLAGALLLDTRGKRRRAGRTRKYVYAVLGAVLAVTTWVALGVNLTQIPISDTLLSTLGVFAFAFIGAAFGVWVNDKQSGAGKAEPAAG